MDIQKHVGGLPQGLDHRHPDADVGDKHPVHHIHMEPVGGFYLLHVPAQVGKVGGEDGGGNPNHSVSFLSCHPRRAARWGAHMVSPPHRIRQAAAGISRLGALGPPWGLPRSPDLPLRRRPGGPPHHDTFWNGCRPCRGHSGGPPFQKPEAGAAVFPFHCICLFPPCQRKAVLDRASLGR